MFKKIFPVVFVAVVLGIVLTKPTLEIKGEANPEDGILGDPTRHAMVQHLESAHGIFMGSTEDSDITLQVEGDQVHVVFQPEFLGRMRPDALVALEMDKPAVYMSEEKFNSFLFMFHAYLTMSPPKPRAGVQVVEHEHN